MIYIKFYHLTLIDYFTLFIYLYSLTRMKPLNWETLSFFFPEENSWNQLHNWKKQIIHAVDRKTRSISLPWVTNVLTLLYKQTLIGIIVSYENQVLTASSKFHRLLTSSSFFLNTASRVLIILSLSLMASSVSDYKDK
jgi:hypothetical protein